MSQPRNQNPLKHADEHQKVFDLFDSPFLYELANRIAPAPTEPRPGRRPEFPPCLMLGMVVVERIFGAAQTAETALKSRSELWARIRESVERHTGNAVSEVPPSASQVSYFRGKFVGAEAWQMVKLAFTEVGVAQANAMRHLERPASRDLMQLRAENNVVGDGTILRRASEVDEIENVVTGEREVTGSRAKDPEKRRRQQRRVTEVSHDGKSEKGIMFVHVRTVTPFGSVELAVDEAPGAELNTALEVIDTVCRVASGGVLGITWDRALQGWAPDQLVHTYQAAVVTRNVVASRSCHLASVENELISQHVSSYAKVLGLTPSQVSVHAAARILATLDGWFAPGPQGQPPAKLTPLGMVRVVGDGREFWASSYHHWLTDIDADGHDGACRHRIYVDHGVLVDVVDDEHGHPVKAPTVIRVASAVPRGADGGTNVEITFEVHCRRGLHTHTVNHWIDEKRRQNGYAKTGPAAALQRLNLFAPQHHQDGADFYLRPRQVVERGHRTIKEWFPRTATRGIARANTEIVEHQRVDFLAALFAINCRTWGEYRESVPDADVRAAETISRLRARRR